MFSFSMSKIIILKPLSLCAMEKIKNFYYKHIYAVIGTLLFHIVLVMSMLIHEVQGKQAYIEPEILIDMRMLDELMKEPEVQEEPEPLEEQSAESASAAAKTNRASNMGADRTEAKMSKSKDPFFDEAFQQEVAEARALAADVSSQLGKKTKSVAEYAMPEENTDGMNPEDISNTIYSGESNIQYDLKNRYHRRLPIPVYLAKAGGKVVVNIWVNNAGKVVKAEIKSVANSEDPFLTEYALQASQRTVFNKDNAAPNPQQGTITYVFVAQ